MCPYYIKHIIGQNVLDFWQGRQDLFVLFRAGEPVNLSGSGSLFFFQAASAPCFFQAAPASYLFLSGPHGFGSGFSIFLKGSGSGSLFMAKK